MGWESPDEWAFENETLAARSAKLKSNMILTSPEMASSTATQVTPSPSKVKCSAAASTTPSSSTRYGTRGKGKEAESVLQKAGRRAATKDGAGTFILSPPDKSFLPLAKIPDLHLFAVAANCGLVFPNLSLAPLSEVLSLILAKEHAQANLAKAVAKAAQAIEQETVVFATETSVVQCSQPSSTSGVLRELQHPASHSSVSIPKRSKALPPLREKPILCNTPARQARMNNLVSQ